MRVCFLTHYFPPEVGAPQTRIDLLARTLAARGVEVTVHTCFPHYPSGAITAPYRNRPWLLERRDGITIVRSAVYPTANRGFARRLGGHASFALSSLATAWRSGTVDVVVGETPPLFIAGSGALYAELKRAAYVVHVADRWPASAVELGALRDPRAIAAASALERWSYRRADLIVCPTEGITESLGRVEEAADKTRRVWPVVDLDRFDPTPRDQQTDREAPASLRLLFAGTVGLAHGLDVLVEASRLAGAGVVQTTIAGDGADATRIRGIVRSQRVGNVRMLGAVGADVVPDLYSDCDASVVLLRDLEIFRGALPTKILEAMAAGRPLVLAARGESTRLVALAGAGIVVAPGDAHGLAEAIRLLNSDPDLRRSLGRAGRSYAEAHFGANRAAEAWTVQLTEAIARNRARSRREARRSAQAAAGRCRAD